MAHILLVCAAEPVYTRVFDPDPMRFARFASGEERETFRRMSLEGPPLARHGETLLDFGNLAAICHDGADPSPPPPGIHFPDSRPRTPERPRVAKSIRYLNGIYLAEFLGRHGIGVDVVNHLEEDFELAEAALERDPRAICISSTFMPNRESVVRIAALAKEYRPDIPVIVGGATAFMSHRVALDATWDPYRVDLKRSYFFQDDAGDAPDPIDYFVVDMRGEETLVRLLRALERKEDARDVPNLAIRGAGGRWRFTRREPERYDPSRHEVRWEDVPDEHLGEAVSVAASSGCPFPCGFCNFDAYNIGMGLKTLDALVEELRHLKRRGYVRRVYFTDDILFPTRKHLGDFCRRLEDEGVADLPWGGFARIDLLRESDAARLGDAGCSFVNMGIESGSRRVQAAMEKRLDPDHVPRMIEALNRRGIWTNSAFVVGFPGETPETVDETIDLLNRYPTTERGINFYASYVFNALPYVPVLAERRKTGLEGVYYDWRHDTMDSWQALRQHRRLDLGVYGALLGYPGDVAGLGRFLDGERASFERVYRVIRLRKELERSLANGASNGAARAREALTAAVRDAVSHAEARRGEAALVEIPKS